MHSVVVLDELGQPVGEGVGGFGSLVDPVACVEGGVLRGLSSPWMLKMSWLKPSRRGQDLYMGTVLVLRCT
jgi:hypothetical protein